MKPTISKRDAQAFKARWQAANEAEREELRRTPVEVKLQQLNSLYAMARQMGWTEESAAEDEEVRERWNRLRKAYGV